MSNLTRREWSRMMLGGLAAASLPLASLAAGKPSSRIRVVEIGAQSYSFRDRGFDEMVAGMVEVGLSSVELWAGHLEPKGSNEVKRKWRETVSMDDIKAARAKLNKAGIQVTSFNYSFRDDFTDREIEQGFNMARALGVKVITASSNVTTAKRVDPFAKKFGIYVAMHNHANIKPNEFATPDDFAKAMESTSRFITVNLDIGHFVAAGFNPMEYLKKNHERVLVVHLKDRNSKNGNLPFGEGETPIREVLALIRDSKWRIPCNIEYEYKGKDTIAEVKKCLEYCRNALES